MTDYFTDLIPLHSWSGVKLDLYGWKFFNEHVLRNRIFQFSHEPPTRLCVLASSSAFAQSPPAQALPEWDQLTLRQGEQWKGMTPEQGRAWVQKNPPQAVHDGAPVR